MKKILITLCIAALLLAGCGGSAAPETPAATTAAETAAPETTLAETDPTPETEAAPVIPADGRVCPQSNGALHVEGASLCDESGAPVQLKGVSTHAITRVAPLINPELFYEMRTQWGINVVRLAMYTLGQDGYTKSDYFRDQNIKLMKQGIDLATQNDLYVIVDWHILDDKSPLLFKEQALEFFDMISSEYKDQTNILYEICNEPNNTEWADIKSYAEEVIPVIRANDPDAVIICGTPDWSQGVDQALADPLEFDNLMYTLHFYSASHKEELRDRMVTCSEAGLPIFVTEYGVTASSGGFPRDLESADLWMQALDERNISCCMWSLAKNGEACCIISSHAKQNSGYATDDLTESGQWLLQMLAQ